MLRTLATLLATLVAALALGACAPVEYRKADLDGKVICDADRMDRIERDARRAGVLVQWVQCPTITLRVI